MGSHYVGQVGLKLLAPSNPASASQSAGITGMSNRAQPVIRTLNQCTHVLMCELKRLVKNLHFETNLWSISEIIKLYKVIS